MDKNISFTLKVWRQKGPKSKKALLKHTKMKRYPGRYFIPRKCWIS